jgi:ATP-dependent DNA helicase PIF1
MQADPEQNQDLRPNRAVEEWMLVCQRHSDLQPDISSQQDFNWSLPALSYSNLEEMPSFLAQQRQSAPQHVFTTSANPQFLQGKQLAAYNAVLQHTQCSLSQLLMIISGTAGTG